MPIIMNERKNMGDLLNKNENLTIMRMEHQKLVAQSNIQARMIRKLELKEEMERCDLDIEAQKKVIAEQDKLIQIQLQADKQKAQQPTA